MGRSSKWDEPAYFSAGVSNPNANPALVEALGHCPERPSRGLSQWDLLGASREVILHRVDSGYEFDLITFSIDATSGRLMLGKDWRMFDVNEEEAKTTIAYCLGLDVPVYPEDDDAADALERLLAMLYTDGFQARTNDGKRVRLAYARERGLSFNSETGVLDVNPIESISPGDALIAAARSSVTFDEFREARSIVRHLEDGIRELTELLTDSLRNESDLQRCLTSHPVLFGLEYKRVIPQYQLGNDFRLDYALERSSGLVDLVEIEASTHKLYTNRGNPTAALVHAEQQVLDWLDWLEANARLARDDLPQMIRPLGQVIIGRSNEISEPDVARLQRRNATLQGALQVLTYDAVLARAQVTLGVLKGPTGSGAH